MAAKKRSTVVGVFEDRLQADQAIAALKAAGFRDDQIGVAMRHDRQGGEAESASEETYAEEGAAAGIVTGLGLGALAGLGVLAGMIPVVGPAIAGGTLGVLFSNAAAGAAVAGLAGALIGWGIPEEEAEFYRSEFEAGRTIVTVQAGNRCAEASDIMRQHGGYDMSSRGAAAGMATRGAARSAEGDTMEVREERLHAEKRPIKAGEVTVRKEVRTETKSIDVPVEREEVVIERRPAHGRTRSDSIREGEEIRIPVSEERVDVTKDAVVTEEVKVGKRAVQDTEHVTGKVRKEEVRVEREGDVDIRSKGKGKA